MKAYTPVFASSPVLRSLASLVAVMCLYQFKQVMGKCHEFEAVSAWLIVEQGLAEDSHQSLKAGSISQDGGDQLLGIARTWTRHLSSTLCLPLLKIRSSSSSKLSGILNVKITADIQRSYKAIPISTLAEYFAVPVTDQCKPLIRQERRKRLILFNHPWTSF